MLVLQVLRQPAAVTVVDQIVSVVDRVTTSLLWLALFLLIIEFPNSRIPIILFPHSPIPPFQECRFNKSRDDSTLRVTWNGNMRITRCESCCMRWYFTLNGDECSDPGHYIIITSFLDTIQYGNNGDIIIMSYPPGPIDAVIFQSRNYHIVRQSTISGICSQIGGNQNLTAGVYRIQFLIQDCISFGGFVYDAYTGWNSVSRITIEELPPRECLYAPITPHWKVLWS